MKIMLAALLLTAIQTVAAAQGTGGARPAPPIDPRRITNDSYRELLKDERERPDSTPTKTTPAPDPAIQKQLRADFRSIQEINNAMMGRALADPGINFQELSADISNITERAIRLRKNLGLPKDTKSKAKASPLEVSNLHDLKAALQILDSQIHGFVQNPIFQTEKLLDIDQAMNASRDLETIILTSRKLTTICDGFSKANQQTIAPTK